MSDVQQQQHRPGALKQQNKSHKTGRHRSKGIVNKTENGRVNAKEMSKKKKGLAGRIQRRNEAQNARRLKREEVLKGKRRRGTASSPPFLVTVVALNENTPSADEIFKLMEECEGINITTSLTAHHVSVLRFKQRFAFVRPSREDTCAVLDAARVADFVMFVVSTDSSDSQCTVDERGLYLATCLLVQGLPASILTISGLKSVATKKQAKLKKDLLDQLNSKITADKVFGLDTTQDALLLLRAIGSNKLTRMHMREARPHLLAERLTFQPDDSSATQGLGTLNVSGYLRGRPLSVNRLVHISGFGDFQMSQISTPTDPHPIQLNSTSRGKNGGGRRGDVDMEDGGVTVITPDKENQESLQAEAEVDPMDAEQTFPTDEELAAADAENRLKRSSVKVPKGTSQYQASWILDPTDKDPSDGDHTDDSDEDDDEDEGLDDTMHADDDSHHRGEGSSGEEEPIDGEEELSEEEEEDETDTVTQNNASDKYDMTTNAAEDEEMLEKFRQLRRDKMFPDEVDTPADRFARDRFQKYRGLKSFRTSPWDADEDLPADYARIFQFKDFKCMRRNLLSTKDDELDLENTVQAGSYVTISVANVPREVMGETYGSYGRPLVLFGLLAHEQKMSVLHFLVKRCHDDTDEPIASKEPMTIHVGYRRFSANPIYSEHTNAGKHKAERFLQPDIMTVATVYAPVMFSPATVLMFKDTPNGEQKLVATGTLLSVDPRRIISKRIVLAGHPFKINKKTATIRHMFFNPEDILWFKPVELRTKCGQHGHIKMALGTHGHMKCVFDSQLKSQDYVLMNLYKRIYPKWTYCPRLVASSNALTEAADKERSEQQRMIFS